MRASFLSPNIIILITLVLFLFIATEIEFSEGGFACLENPCAHGICIDDINSPHQCYCQNGFTGYSCEQNWDECQSWGPSPCLNGGTCLDGIASFNCSCPEPFAGRLCEINLSTCDEVYPCQNNGTCSYNSGGVGTGLYCLCPPGFKGIQCEEDISICNETLNICLNGGKCIDDIGKKFYCQCEIGWEGRNCEMPIDECASSPCMNDGVCVDKVGDFSCACPFSYTGKACETELEICSESPCQNDGFCLEEEGKKVCYCIPDFHGEFCEQQYNECDTPTNRCLNGGTCIDGVGAFTCSCPSGFLGSTCQCPLDMTSDRINSSLIPSECSTIIPGSNASTVSPTTPSEGRGDLGSISTTRVIHEGVLTATTAFPQFGAESPTMSMSFPLSMGAETTVHVPLSPTPILTLQLSSSILMSSDSPYDPGGPSASSPLPLEFGTVFMSSSAIPSLTPSPSPSPSPPPGLESQDYFLTSTVASSALIVPSSPAPAPGPTPIITDFMEDTALTDMETTSTYDPCPTLSLDDKETESWAPSPSMGLVVTPTNIEDLVSSTGLHSQMLPVPVGTGSLQPSPSAPVSGRTPLSSPLLSRDENELITEFPLTPSPTLLVTGTPSPSLVVSDTFDSSLWEIPDSQAATMTLGLGSQSRTILYPSETMMSGTFEASPTISIPGRSEGAGTGRIDISEYGPESSSRPIGMTPLVSISSVGLEMESSISTSTFSPSQTPYLSMSLPSGSGLFIPPLASEELISQRSRDGVEGGMARTTSMPFFSPTPVLQTPVPSSAVIGEVPTTTSPPPQPTLLPPNLSDPCENYCSNNAKCISTTIEPICVCPFTFTGVRCETREIPVEIPSFAGDSFLKYELPRASSNIIDISAQMATVVPDGILVYSAIGRIYAFIYLQNGLVTLHFSCGAQSMNFVETRTRVDNGFNFTLSFRLENIIDGNAELRCVGQVSLNDSYIMRGEQVVDRNAMLVLEHPVKKVFLGGLDHPELYHNDDIIRLLPGFRGCVYRLEVNQEVLSMYEDAMDGREISECSTFGCVVDPCAGHSRCVSSNQYPFWECICPAGFEGSRCNIRACGVNPCKNGATCTTILNDNNNSTMRSSNESNSISSSSSKCLCPLGFGGALCQSRVNISKPSFHGTPDYSSFVAYDPIPRFADWMQLKFHFITHNMSQIALLMFSGSETENVRIARQQLDSPIFDSADNEQASDFFAISFLQGFIALTWNLGSGTQRITSPSRIDNRLNVHSLFAGRHGRQAWLKVDGMRNTTGKTPGPLYRLNVHSDMFVGGHEVPRFEGLPHDFPLHTGFQGCIFDLGFRVKNKLYLPRPLRGRNVINCYEDC